MQRCEQCRIADDGAGRLQRPGDKIGERRLGRLIPAVLKLVGGDEERTFQAEQGAVDGKEGARGEEQSPQAVTEGGFSSIPSY